MRDSRASDLLMDDGYVIMLVWLRSELSGEVVKLLNVASSLSVGFCFSRVEFFGREF